MRKAKQLTAQRPTMAADPFVGTWKLNVANSKVTDPSAMPKSLIYKAVAIDNGIKDIFDGVDAEGKAFHMEAPAIYDGKDHPIKGDPRADMLSIRRIDANTVLVVIKKAGKAISKLQITVSKDGKTRTVAGNSITPKGQPYSGTFVYDKQ